MNKIIINESLYDGYVYIQSGKIVKVSKECESADEIHDFIIKALGLNK